MYRIISIKKNIIALSGTNNDIEFHNKLFNTDDCVIEFVLDPTQEEIDIQKEQNEIHTKIERRKLEIIIELNELDLKAIRPLLDGEVERIEEIKNQKNILREEYNSLIKESGESGS